MMLGRSGSYVIKALCKVLVGVAVGKERLGSQRVQVGRLELQGVHRKLPHIQRAQASGRLWMLRLQYGLISLGLSIHLVHEHLANLQWEGWGQVCTVTLLLQQRRPVLYLLVQHHLHAWLGRLAVEVTHEQHRDGSTKALRTLVL